MIDTVPRPDASLPEFLAARARHASDGTLAACAGVGVFAIISGILLPISGWYLVIATGTLALGFGAWGIADRELAERAGASRAIGLTLQAVRVVAALAGFASGLFLMMTLLGKTLGTIIS